MTRSEKVRRDPQCVREEGRWNLELLGHPARSRQSEVDFNQWAWIAEVLWTDEDSLQDSKWIEWLWFLKYVMFFSTCLVSRLSLTLCDPWAVARQAPLSMGFSRQEHWSGFPFPSPMHESEKWKWNRSVVSDSSQPHGLQPTRLLCPWDFPGRSTGMGCHCLLQGIFPTQGLNLCLLPCRRIIYHLSHQGSPYSRVW